MTLLLHIKDPNFFRRRSTGVPVRTINLDVEPSPVIMADGIRSVSIDKYWLEETMSPSPRADAKPAYRVPTMAEIARIRPNGYRVMSTFAGGGGSSLGYRMAGFKVAWASEFVEAARDVYRANASPATVVDGRDIREVDPLAVLRDLGIAPGELDVLDGSPPCSSFSTAGKREKGWGAVKKYSDTAQRTDDLFEEYVRFIAAIRPRVFIAENVSGLVKGTAKGYFLMILRAMKALRYRVEARLLDAQWLGVPQQRQRIIFVGVREDLGVAPRHPEPLPHRYSVRDAITGLTVVEPESDISRFAIGAEYDRLNPGQQSDRYFSLVRPALDEPCPTVTAAGGEDSIASVVHPSEKRKFSIAELKRICSFPDDFALTGTYPQQWERMGRAVPPLMMRAIAREVEVILRQADAKKPGRAPHSQVRSTNGSRPTGGATRRSGRRRPAETGTPEP